MVLNRRAVSEASSSPSGAKKRNRPAGDSAKSEVPTAPATQYKCPLARGIAILYYFLQRHFYCSVINWLEFRFLVEDVYEEEETESPWVDLKEFLYQNWQLPGEGSITAASTTAASTTTTATASTAATTIITATFIVLNHPWLALVAGVALFPI